MQDFEYIAPRTLSEAVALMSEKGESARPLAGGTDILVQLRGGRRSVERIVDVKHVPELNEMSFSRESGLVLGAAVPCYRLYQDQDIAQAYPGIMDAASMIGGIQIQGRASVGGNLCNAAPSADAIPPLIVHNATCVIAGQQGTREIAVEEFCTAPGRNVLQGGELLVSMRIPAPKSGSGGRYLRFIPRNEMDIAVAGVGSWVQLSPDNRSIVSARVALASVAPTPLFVEESGARLAGREVSKEAIEDAAQAAMEAARPISDMRGTIQQRRHLVGVLTRRTLEGAIARATN
ncbi:MAG: xanthine dehydrogenase family protein subunit M [Dehalococcoidia bacterium]|nr:xanthine dehydrogenase family protein subunit M [Dehalococcoidia bacterium]